jgi:ubiquinone/menaquinone biosynthesis C-methylase UbiE
MSTLSSRTAIKYRGRMAANYEAKRKKQIRWDLENQLVSAMLHTLHGSVLDVPVGTGRFLKLYQDLKLECTGIDTSDEMLALARKKRLPGKLLKGNATAIDFPNKSFDHVVCVRFLDLIDEPAMLQVVKELCRVAKQTVIFTIRLGEKYILKVNTATHNARKFRNYVKKQGWLIAEEQPIFKQGWLVIRLRRENGWIQTRILEHPATE